MENANRWAEVCFGNAELGDERRTERLVRMAHSAAAKPAGRVTQVFRTAAERQAAYDFLEHDSVSRHSVAESLFCSTASESRKHERVLIAVDGTSIQLVDDADAKGFGHIGSFLKGAHGLKLINALALTWDGTPLGVADQTWWSRHERADPHYDWSSIVRESVKWRDTIRQVGDRYAEHAPNTKLHFLGDREADANKLMKQLMGSGHEFTIRSNATRKVAVGSRRCDLKRQLKKKRPLARLVIELPATARRSARTAVLEIRAAYLPIVWRNRSSRTRHVAPLTVVWARERSHSSTKIEWFLFTNVKTTTASEACDAVRRYTQRWRIEDFHKTWKSGVCNVEDTQLRSTNAVIKWATILAAVAARIERLRRRFREEPDAPASTELSSDEIEALVFLTQTSGQQESANIDRVTIAEATRWIADLGGYVGGRGGGPPGATTLARGFERVQFAVELITKLRTDGRMR